MINYEYPAPWLYAAYRNALHMARAYRTQRHMRVVYQERAADYRETIIDSMRRRNDWILAERWLGKRY